LLNLSPDYDSRRHQVKQIKGGDPVVDDSTKNELLVRWPTQKPKGEFVIKFTEQCGKHHIQWRG